MPLTAALASEKVVVLASGSHCDADGACMYQITGVADSNAYWVRVSAHNAAAMLECAQRVAAESDAREAYHVERRQEARCPTTVPTYCTYPVHEQARTTYQPTYLPNTPSADLIT